MMMVIPERLETVGQFWASFTFVCKLLTLYTELRAMICED
jgi:hypothetical protein